MYKLKYNKLTREQLQLFQFVLNQCFVLFQTNKKNPQTSQICHHGVVSQNPQESQNGKLVGVGGGGGGGTYIFKVIMFLYSLVYRP